MQYQVRLKMIIKQFNNNMKSINEFIIEKLKVSKSKPGDCTIEEFLVWYYFDNKYPIEDLTFEEFSSIDFAPNVVEVYFDNNEKKLYDFLMDNLDVEIKLYKLDEGGYPYYRFFIDNISFIVEINDGEFWKK